MIPADRGPSRGLGAMASAEPAGEVERLIEVLEADLDRHLLALSRAHPDLVSEGRLEPVGGVPEGSLLLGVEPLGRCRPILWLAGQLGPVLGLADRPAVACRFAAQASADVVAAGGEERLAVTLAELSRLKQVEQLVGQVKEPDQV